MRIGTKISAGFAAMVVLTVVLGLAGWLGLDRYAGSVQGADRIAAVAERVGSANSDAVRFRASGDRGAVNRANANLRQAMEVADEIGAAGLSEAIQRFEQSFAELVRLTGEADGLTADMRASSEKLVQHAEAILSTERARYGSISQAQRDAVEAQTEKLKGAQAAESLIRATLTAGREEAMFRMSRGDEQADQARNAIKQMFLAALMLKKAAGDGEAGELAGKLATAVSNYRKSFEVLAKATPDTPEAQTAATELATVSAEINTLSNDVSRMQIDSYDQARTAAEEAGATLENAVGTMMAALEMVADVRSLSLQQTIAARSTGDQDSQARVQAAIATLESDLGALTLEASEKTTQDALTAAGQEIDAYKSAFGSMVAALAQQSQAAAAMSKAAEDVDATVAQSVSAFDAARDSDGNTARIVIAGATAGAALLAILVALILGRGITVPIRSMTGAMNRLAADDTEVEVPGRDRKDEIADMAKAVQVFKENAERMRAMEAERLEADRRAAEDKQRAMAELADSFEQSVGSVVASLSGFVNDVRSRAEIMTEASEQAQQQATGVASSSEEASANVQAVSAAAEELAASVTEIGSQVARAAEMARRASDEAKRGDTRVQALADTATRIGDVLTLIQDIAEQTNLLALNATIEAARAGEAGKGFAVVASEVKNLASQTAKATEDIRTQIEDIQQSSRDAVSAIQSIGEAVTELDAMNGAVAAAVEQQSATTNEIARNTQEAAAGSSQVSVAIVEVSSASERTGEGASAVLAMCSELAGAADTLNHEVRDFLSRIRAG